MPYIILGGLLAGGWIINSVSDAYSDTVNPQNNLGTNISEVVKWGTIATVAIVGLQAYQVLKKG